MVWTTYQLLLHGWGQTAGFFPKRCLAALHTVKAHWLDPPDRSRLHWTADTGQAQTPLGLESLIRVLKCTRACHYSPVSQSNKAARSHYGTTAPAGLYFTVGDVWLAGTEVFALAALWVTALAAAELASWVSGPLQHE